MEMDWNEDEIDPMCNEELERNGKELSVASKQAIKASSRWVRGAAVTA